MAAPLASLLLTAALVPDQPPAPRLDALGDPLPPGAVARLGTTRFRHADGAGFSGVVFAPDGKTAATPDDAGRSVYIWDVATGKALHRLRVDTRPVTNPRRSIPKVVAFSPDGKTLAVAGGSVALWNPATGGQVAVLDPKAFNPVGAVCFTADGKQVVCSSQAGEVRWYDVAKRQRVQSWTIGDHLNDAELPTVCNRTALSPDGRVLMAHFGRDDWRAQKEAAVHWTVAWDLTANKELWRLRDTHLNWYGFASSADGTLLACRTAMEGVHVHEVTTGKERGRLALQKIKFKEVGGLAFAPDGKTLAVSGRPGGVVVWDCNAPDSFREFAIPPTRWNGKDITSLAFSPDGKSLLAAVDSFLRLVDVVTGDLRLTWPGHQSPVYQVAFTADGRRLLSQGITDGNADLLTWEVATGKLLGRSHYAALAAKFKVGAPSADHRLGLRKAGDSKWEVVDLATGKVIVNLQSPKASLWGGSFSPAGTAFVSSPNSMRQKFVVFDLKSGQPRFALDDPDGRIWALTFSPDEKKIAWRDDNVVVHVLDAITGKELAKLGDKKSVYPRNYGQAIAFSPDGTLLAAVESGGSTVVIWNVGTGAEVGRMTGQREAPAPCLVWSPDGRMLAVGGGIRDDRIELWETTTWKLRHTLTGHDSRIEALAFSPDGRLLASGSMDTTVLLWDVYARIANQQK
jgi:WD40 repeat protein